MKKIPIAAAKRIAEEYGYHQVIILGRATGDDGEHVTTYGTNKEHRHTARLLGDYLKYKVMGWSKNDQDDLWDDQ